MSLISIIWVESKDDGKIEIFTGDLFLNASRLMCAILLHMQTMPEVRTSIDMMWFALSSPDKFKDRGNFVAFLIALSKITGGFMTEVINLLKMGQTYAVQDIVKDFIAFGIISEIDDLIVPTIKGVDIEAMITSDSNKLSFSVDADQ